MLQRTDVKTSATVPAMYVMTQLLSVGTYNVPGMWNIFRQIIFSGTCNVENFVSI